MNALSRPTDSVYSTTLFLIGGWYTSKTTAAEAKRVELDFVQLRWPDAESPDKKVSSLDKACGAGGPAAVA
jgi:hypothetical protein